MASGLMIALGIALILEGLMPLLSPMSWRQTMARIAALRDGQIRFMGLVATSIGAFLVLAA